MRKRQIHPTVMVEVKCDERIGRVRNVAGPNLTLGKLSFSRILENRRSASKDIYCAIVVVIRPNRRCGNDFLR